MLIDKNNFNRKKWLKYIKVFEEFNKEIPNELRDIFNKIRKELGNPTKSFTKILDLNDYNFVDIRVKLIVNFTEISSIEPYENRKVIWYSNININDLNEKKHIVDIPINIIDTHINIDRLSSTISHELRHIYDYYVANDEADMKSFTDGLYINLLKNNHNNPEFLNFLELVYLSLEHELIARNTMIYENFINCRCNKEELIELFKKTYIYESLIILKSFNHNKLNYNNELLKNTNDLIKYFGGNLCNNIEDVKIIYKNWENYFKLKSDEYIEEAYKVLDDIYNVIKENSNHKMNMTAKELLLDIYNKYIKK
jgi:hypothetical protein